MANHELKFGSDAYFEAMASAEEASSAREPLEADSGFYAYGDAPAAIGGGFGAFYWFESEEKALGHLDSFAIFINPPRSDIDAEAEQKGCSQAIAEYREKTLTLADLIVRLNAHLKHASVIEWIGPMSDLQLGAPGFAQQVLSDFREEESEDPVGADEFGEFIEFLSMYGL